VDEDLFWQEAVVGVMRWIRALCYGLAGLLVFAGDVAVAGELPGLGGKVPGALLFRLRFASFHQHLRADAKAVVSGDGVYYPFVDYVHLMNKYALDRSIFINIGDIREDKRDKLLASGVVTVKASDGAVYVLYPLSLSLDVLRPDRVPALMPIP
jgi:hypothetical protein